MPPTTINLRDFYYILPEMVLTLWGLVVLTVDFWLLRRKPSTERRQILGWLTLAGVALAVLSTIVSFPGSVFDIAHQFGADPTESDVFVFYGTIAADVLTRWFSLLVAVLLGLVVSLSMSWTFTEHWGEYFALLCWAAVGMMFLIAAEELLTLFLTLETMTLCLYLSAAFERGRRRSAEAGLKYFVYGSVSSALFLFGLSMIYGMTGSTRIDAIESALLPLRGREVGIGQTLVAGAMYPANVAGAAALLLILVGFGFKVAAVPFHMWAPDVYEGAPAPVTAWIASGSKVASFVAMMKVLVHALGPWSHGFESLMSPGWVGIVAVISAATMTYGNFAALAQTNLKRMLAYSSIAHAGYMLVGVLAASIALRPNVAYEWNREAAGSVLFYLVVYAISTVGAFAVAAWLTRDRNREDIDDLNGLGYRSPALAVCIVVLMLSLIGVPPLGGFFGKLYMFMEALNVGEQGRLTMVWLVALALFNSVVSAFYYVRVLKAMFFRQPERGALGPASRAIAWPIGISTLVVVAAGIFPAPLLNQMAEASVPMLSAHSTFGYTTYRDSDRQGTVPRPLNRQEQEARQRQLEQMSGALQGVAGPGGGGAPRAKAATKRSRPPAQSKAAPKG